MEITCHWTKLDRSAFQASIFTMNALLTFLWWYSIFSRLFHWAIQRLCLIENTTNRYLRDTRGNGRLEVNEWQCCLLHFCEDLKLWPESEVNINTSKYLKVTKAQKWNVYLFEQNSHTILISLIRFIKCCSITINYFTERKSDGQMPKRKRRDKSLGLRRQTNYTIS